MSQPTSLVQCERFRPQRVEGLREVIEVAIFSDRLELLTQSAATLTIVEFVDVAAWPFPGFLWKWAFRQGLGRRTSVAEIYRPSGGEPYIKWLGQPPIEVYRPADESAGAWEARLARIQKIVEAGGFRMTG
jgi:hypothetical protein